MSITVLLQVYGTKGMTVQTACLLCGLQLDEGWALFASHTSAWRITWTQCCTCFRARHWISRLPLMRDPDFWAGLSLMLHVAAGCLLLIRWTCLQAQMRQSGLILLYTEVIHYSWLLITSSVGLYFMWMLLSVIAWNISTGSCIQSALEIPCISRIVILLAILVLSLFANISSSSILLRWAYQRTGGLRVIVGIRHDTIDLREVALWTCNVIWIQHMRRANVVVKLLRRLRLLHRALMTLALRVLLLCEPLILWNTLSNFPLWIKIGASLLLLLVEDVLVW